MKKNVIAGNYGTNHTLSWPITNNNNNNNDNNNAINNNNNNNNSTVIEELETEEDSEKYECSQCVRKSIVLICGLSFVVVGILILVFFLSFINDDFKNKCIYDNASNDNNNEWFDKHPELKNLLKILWQTSCQYV